MDEAVKQMARAVKQAIRSEIEGHHFYKMAAAATADAQAREVFERLAGEELEHVGFLRAQHRSLVESGRADAATRLGQPATFTGDSPIFSPALVSRLAEAHYEMSALSIAIGLELSAINFYRSAARAAKDAEVQAFFNQLADWEAGHYNTLQRQQEMLKEDYWEQASFSPF